MDIEFEPGIDRQVNGGTSLIKTPLSVHEIIRLHHTVLLNWLRGRLSIPEDAYDVAQEAYVRMLKYEGSRDIQSPLAILKRIAMNVAYDLGRANRSRHSDRHVRFEETDIESNHPSIEHVIEAEENYRQVCKAIADLPFKCRQVFLLNRIRGMSYAEIATHCDISVKMVEKHISQALLVCMQSLGE